MRKDLNLGVAKAIVSSKITNEFLNESKIGDSEGLMASLVETITKSPILMKEYTVYNNIENKHSNNDIITSKFIDHNMSTFTHIPREEVSEAHELLNVFIDGESLEGISESKIKLYNSIGTLINEWVNPDADLNEVHEAYEVILNHIRENVEKETEEPTTSLDENIDLDAVVEIATNDFNTTFSSLTEAEIELVNKLVYGSDEEKKNIFESLKTENVGSLESLESNGVEDKINEAIDKLNKMVYNEETIAKDIVELENLKESLN